MQIYSDIFTSYSDIFSHFCGIFRTLCNSCILRTLSCSEFWHIQNLRCIQNSIKAYSGIFRTLCDALILRTLPYSELCHIQNLGIFRTRGIFRILFTYLEKRHRGKFSGGKGFRRGKLFVTWKIFRRIKLFSPVIIESNHFLTFFIAFDIINQSINTRGTSLVSLVMGSPNVTVFSSCTLTSISSF